MWGRDYEVRNDYDNSYWPQLDTNYGPQQGWQAHQRRHQTDQSMPPAYAQGIRRPLITPRTDVFAASGAFDLGPRLPVPLLPPSAVPLPYGNPMSSHAPQPISTNTLSLYQDFNDPLAPLPIKVTCKTSAVLCEVQWAAPPFHSSQQPYKFKVDAHANHVETVELPQWKTNMRIKTTPGEWYTVEVRAVCSGRQIAYGKIEFRAVFSRQEVEQLYERATNYCGSEMHQFEVLYRCKPRPYFDDIKYHRDNVMEKYIKDNNGQAANPTNGEIYGLFFSARLTPSLTIPQHSPFGDIRMVVPALRLFDPNRVHIYFSDFYCNYTTHYVTITCCERGSDTDQFCSRVGLILLNPADNPFMKCFQYPSYHEYWVAKKVWVEFYYTENVQLAWGNFSQITATFAGSSRPGGLPHNKFCRICNLYPQTNTNEEPDTDDTAEELKSAKRAAEENDEDESGDNMSAKRRRHIDFEYNTTFHLSMELERERLIEEHVDGAAADEVLTAARLPGDVDLVDTMCYLVDWVIQDVGESILVPEHGVVGQPYRVTRELPTSLLSSPVSAYNPDDAVKLLPKLDLESLDGKENLDTDRGKATFQRLQTINEDLDRRCRELQKTLSSLQSSVALLEKRVKPLL